MNKYLLFLICILILISGCNNNNVNEELTKCIAEKSLLYVSTGCSACAKQKAIFGDNYKFLNKVDCAIFPEKCREANITVVPTWIINNETIKGVQDIEELKQLTNC